MRHYVITYTEKVKEKNQKCLIHAQNILHAIGMFYDGYGDFEIIGVIKDKVAQEEKEIVVGSVVEINQVAGWDFPKLRGIKCVVSGIDGDGFASLRIDGEPYKHKLGIKGELKLWKR